MRLHRLLFASVTLGYALAATSCSSEPSATASGITANSGTSLNGTVGTAVTTAPSVKVTSSKGGGFSGATVTFTASNGSSVTSGTVTTDDEGIATVGSWVLGQATGSYTLTAAVGSLTGVTFTATAAAGPPANVTIVSGNLQTAGVGAAVPQPLVVLVKDQYNNPVNNALIAYQVVTGNGSLPAGGASTDANGQASKSGWVLGTVSGTQTLSATVGSVTPTVFSATATPGAPASLVAGPGDGQAGDLNVALTTPLSAKVADQFGNGVQGTTVNFAVTSGGATLGSATAVSNALGMATTAVTLTSPGVTNVSATATGLGALALSVNTGPTIAGTITMGAGAAGPPSARGGAAANTRAGSTNNFARPAASNASAPHGRLIVTFKPGAFGMPAQASAMAHNSSMVAQATAAYREALRPIEQSGHIVQRAVSPAIAASLVEVAPGRDVAETIAELRRDPRVQSVEEDELLQIAVLEPTAEPQLLPDLPVDASSVAGFRAAPTTERYASDPMLNQQLWHYAMVNAFRVWPTTTGSSSVRIGVIDTGVRPEHPALAGMISSTDGFDFIDATTLGWASPQTVCGGGSFQTIRGPEPYRSATRIGGLDAVTYGPTPNVGGCWPLRTYSHGTHVSGTILSAGNDGVGGTGLNWSGTIVPIRVCGTGGCWSFDIAQGILYAGGLPATYVGAPGGATVQIAPTHIMNLSLGGPTFNTAMANAVTAASANTVIIAAAGNENNSQLQYPASYPEVISVSALGPSYSRASYSSFGSTVSLSAPGGDVAVNATSGVLSTNYNHATAALTYTYLDGTSMATPHVTGVAALIKAANPSFTAAQIKARLLASVVDLGTPGRDNTYGFGLIDAYKAITGTTGPSTVTTVKVIDAATGATVRSTTVSVGGSYAFTRLPAGSYLVVAGQDEAGDGLFGVPGRKMASAGAAITLSGLTPVSGNLTLGSIQEIEPNNATVNAHLLAVGSWVQGALPGGDAMDMFALNVGTGGTYTFETSGVLGACGFATEVNTALRVVSATGTQMGQNDDTAYPTASYPGTLCSMVSVSLTPGKYYIEVTPSAGSSGNYRLNARSGN